MPGTPRADPFRPQSKAPSARKRAYTGAPPSKDGKEFQFLLHLIKEETDRKADALACGVLEHASSGCAAVPSDRKTSC